MSGRSLAQYHLSSPLYWDRVGVTRPLARCSMSARGVLEKNESNLFDHREGNSQNQTSTLKTFETLKKASNSLKQKQAALFTNSTQDTL